MSHDMFKQISDIGYIHGLKVCSTHMLEIYVSHLDVSLDAPICAPAVLHQPVVLVLLSAVTHLNISCVLYNILSN